MKRLTKVEAVWWPGMLMYRLRIHAVMLKKQERSGYKAGSNYSEKERNIVEGTATDRCVRYSGGTARLDVWEWSTQG